MSKKQTKDEIVKTNNELKRQHNKFIPWVKPYMTSTGFDRYMKCNNTFDIIANDDKKQVKGIRHKSCHFRFCPICARNKSKNDADRLKLVINDIKNERPDLAPVFITFTVENVKTEKELKETKDIMLKAFKEIYQKYKVFETSDGAIRKLEITHNHRNNTYHPHLHILAFVSIKALKSHGKDYISNKDMFNAWKKSLRQKGFKGKLSKLGFSFIREPKHIENELSKYMTKLDQIKTKQEFDVLYHVLNRSKVITSFGICFDCMKLARTYPLMYRYVWGDTGKNIQYVQKLSYTWQMKNNEYLQDTKNWQPLEIDELIKYNMSEMEQIKLKAEKTIFKENLKYKINHTMNLTVDEYIEYIYELVSNHL